jgi:hypothetical protein
MTMPKRDRRLFEPEVPMWKIRSLIKDLGGVSGVTEKLMAKGFLPPSPDAVQGWYNRNSVPGPWSPALFALAQDAGIIEGPMGALIKDFRLERKSQQK